SVSAFSSRNRRIVSMEYRPLNSAYRFEAPDRAWSTSVFVCSVAITVTSAARHVPAVALGGLFDHVVGLPAPPIRVGRPHLVLSRVTTRLTGLDVDREAGCPQPVDRKLHRVRSVDGYAVMG